MAVVTDLLQRHRSIITATLVTLVAILGIAAVRHLASEITYRALHDAIMQIPGERILFAVGLTAVSYLALTLYDLIALRAIGRPMPWRKAAVASFTSYTLSHNLGLSLLTGGTARYRIYSQEGLEAGEVASVIAIASLTFWSGVTLCAGAGILFGSAPIPFVDAGSALRGAIGAALLAAGLAPLALRLLGVRHLQLGGWRLVLPDAAGTLVLTGAALVDLTASSAALFVLAPGLAPALWPALFTAYATALVVGLVSHVPGGIGVFEATIVAAIPSDRPELLAALLLYRAVYYLLPLFCAVVLLLWVERRSGLATLAQSLKTTGRFGMRSLLPPLLSGLVFLGGCVLLLSSATPALHGRAEALARIVPLPFIEASHVAASLAGTVLLYLAHGLWRRLDGAAAVARVILLAGAVFSIFKGFDYEEAVICLAIAILLRLSRKAFYRRTALLAEPLGVPWTLAIIAALIGTAIAAAFAYSHVEYSSGLWWRFVAHDGAPRALRAALAIVVLISAFVLWRFMRPARTIQPGREFDPARFRAALSGAEGTDAFLALTGDKRFVYSPEGDAFVMFGRIGDTWIMLGDPVGPRERWQNLLWTLRQDCDEAQCRLLLYQITEQCLPHAIDMGMRVAKYGEEAILDLRAFSLDGPYFKPLRHSVRRAQAQGARFEIVPAERVEPILAQLREVSDEWLAEKARAEKGFSLGSFDPDYLKQFPMAVVIRDERIVAFANVLALPNRSELSIDLMRHRAGMPYGTMDFLFVELMRWGQAHGYATFNLGLAPLSGLPRHRLAPLIGQAGDLLFRKGERFYGFGGLRAYKSKFAPRWRGRYVAAPSGLALLRSILSVRAIVSRSGAVPSERLSRG